MAIGENERRTKVIVVLRVWKWRVERQAGAKRQYPEQEVLFTEGRTRLAFSQEAGLWTLGIRFMKDFRHLPGSVHLAHRSYISGLHWASQFLLMLLPRDSFSHAATSGGARLATNLSISISSNVLGVCGAGNCPHIPCAQPLEA